MSSNQLESNIETGIVFAKLFKQNSLRFEIKTDNIVFIFNWNLDYDQ